MPIQCSALKYPVGDARGQTWVDPLRLLVLAGLVPRSGGAQRMTDEKEETVKSVMHTPRAQTKRGVFPTEAIIDSYATNVHRVGTDNDLGQPKPPTAVGQSRAP